MEGEEQGAGRVQLEAVEDVEALLSAVRSALADDAEVAARVEHTLRRNVDAASATASRAEFLPFAYKHEEMNDEPADAPAPDSELESLRERARSLRQQVLEARERAARESDASMRQALESARPPEHPDSERAPDDDEALHIDAADARSDSSAGATEEAARAQHHRSWKSVEQLHSLLPKLEEDEGKLKRLIEEAERAASSCGARSEELEEALRETPGGKDANRRRLSRLE
jgi:ABC-type transporter Mla subunit MlaD